MDWTGGWGKWYPLVVRPDFLFAMPTWLTGASRALDLAGQFDEYNESRDGEEADARALFADWRVVGESLLDAVMVFRREPQGPAPNPNG